MYKNKNNVEMFVWVAAVAGGGKVVGAPALLAKKVRDEKLARYQLTVLFSCLSWAFLILLE